jgi:pimeloyl-ACP methyl ester carboxylesterase
MTIFRRTVRWLFLLAGFVAGIVVTMAAIFARRMINPPRQRLWATPGDVGLAYEDVQFPAHDGTRLSGWFVPAPANSYRKGATIILVHGWLWNRLGEAAADVFSNLIGATPVDLLQLTLALHRDGFHVLMFDWRNHGQSAAVSPVTFGREEARDLLGALAYVNGRQEVDAARIGVIGFSAGANILLYTLSETNRIKAGIAVQPTTISTYAARFSVDMFGLLGKVVVPVAELLYRLGGGPPLDAFRPATAVTAAGDVPILYIQGGGDPWGSPEDVAHMAAATPQASEPLIVETIDRFGGYQYLIAHPEIATAFFEQHFPE